MGALRDIIADRTKRLDRRVIAWLPMQERDAITINDLRNRVNLNGPIEYSRDRIVHALRRLKHQGRVSETWRVCGEESRTPGRSVKCYWLSRTRKPEARE
jgi:hypothetical protein